MSPSLQRKGIVDTYDRRLQQPGMRAAIRAITDTSAPTPFAPTTQSVPDITSTPDSGPSDPPPSTPIFETTSVPTTSSISTSSTSTSTDPVTSSPSDVFSTSTSTEAPPLSQPVSTVESTSTDDLPLSSSPASFSVPSTTDPPTSGQLPKTSTITTTSVSQTATSRPSNGFFSHTGMVIGVFTAVGVVILLLLSILCICVCNRRRTSDDDTIFPIAPYDSYHGGEDIKGVASPPATRPAPSRHPHHDRYERPARAYDRTTYNSERYYHPRSVDATMRRASRPPRSPRPSSYENPFYSRNPPKPSAGHAPVNIRSPSSSYRVPSGARESFYQAEE